MGRVFIGVHSMLKALFFGLGQGVSLQVATPDLALVLDSAFNTAKSVGVLNRI